PTAFFVQADVGIRDRSQSLWLVDVYKIHDPNLTDTVLIGEDGMALFAYSFADDCFQIRDKASTDYVIESHTEFDRFLSSLIQTVS
ncbi:hypothetical protein D3H66_26145, partial [Citrobacter portucalensis]